ncbi:hypothetical protein [Mucilaginibacter sp.]|uniref:hypothetical protein n=1 Tax=Mucilaginibacter sp. TaxID=1882438 RepID=UPI00283CA5D6|nr:hypothetical protein [Mucilaginibacter sp.]MDR3696252.1 hypothetical protein [Mucilaginibacter sp.]
MGVNFMSGYIAPSPVGPFVAALALLRTSGNAGPVPLRMQKAAKSIKKTVKTTKNS